MSVVEEFERGDVDAAAFGHRAHVRVAWHYLDAMPLLEALPRCCAALERLAIRHDAAAKYNATLSVAVMLLIRDRMRTGEGWEAFESREQAFLADGLGSVRAYYGQDQLDGAEARRAFQLPRADVS